MQIDLMAPRLLDAVSHRLELSDWDRRELERLEGRVGALSRCVPRSPSVVRRSSRRHCSASGGANQGGLGGWMSDMSMCGWDSLWVACLL